MKKKLIISFLVLLVVILAIVITVVLKELNTGRTENNIEKQIITFDDLTIEEIENLSDKNLREFAKYGEEYPKDFILDELKDYDRIISSSNSEKDAKEKAIKQYDNSKIEIIQNEIVLETDLLYGLEIGWLHGLDYHYGRSPSVTNFLKVISFKEDIVKDHKIQTNDIEKIEEFLNVNYGISNHGDKVIKSFITEKEDKFEYSIYYIEIIGGDYGCSDILDFYKDVVHINKSTGEMVKERELTIKRDITIF